MVIYPLVLPVPPPLKGVGGTRALAHSIRYIYIYMYVYKYTLCLVHIFFIMQLRHGNASTVSSDPKAPNPWQALAVPSIDHEAGAADLAISELRKG